MAGMAKKMEDGQDQGQIIRDTRGWHYGVIVIVFRSLDFCRRWEIKSDLKELHQDNREIHGDRRELHGDFKELKGDRKELRGDIKSGAGDTEIAQDRKEIRRGRREIKGDRHALGKDHRERRGDKRELRRDTSDSQASNWALFLGFHGCRLLMEGQPSLGFRTWYNHA